MSNEINVFSKAAELSGLQWFNENGSIIEVKKKEMTSYGDWCVRLKFQNEVTLECSYLPSEGTNFCCCSEHNPQYNNIHRCCGVECDWEIPVVTRKVGNKQDRFIYKGNQKELWTIS